MLKHINRKNELIYHSYSMRIVKHFETKLNVSPEEMYMGNMDQILLDKLRAHFEGVCENKSFVVQIREITKRSMIKMDKSDLQGGGSVSVSFSADVIVYPHGSILVGCEIKNMERDGHILCQYENTSIFIRGNKNMQIPADNRLIIQVTGSTYLKGSKTITIFGTLFHIPTDLNMLIVDPSSEFSQENKDALAAKLDEIKEAQAVLQKQPKKLIQFFSDVFYPIEKDPVFPKEFMKIDLIKISQDIISNKSALNNGKTIIMTRHPAIRKETAFAFGVVPESDKKITNSWMNPQNFSSIKFNPSGYFTALMNFHQDHLEYTRALTSMCNVYKTEVMRNSHKKLWALYDRFKIKL